MEQILEQLGKGDLETFLLMLSTRVGAEHEGTLTTTSSTMTEPVSGWLAWRLVSITTEQGLSTCKHSQTIISTSLPLVPPQLGWDLTVVMGCSFLLRMNGQAWTFSSLRRALML